MIIQFRNVEQHLSGIADPHHSSEVAKPLFGRIVGVFAQVPLHVCHHQQCLSVQQQTVCVKVYVKVCVGVVIGSHNV